MYGGCRQRCGTSACVLNGNTLRNVVGVYNEVSLPTITRNTRTYNNVAPLAALNGCSLWTVDVANEAPLTAVTHNTNTSVGREP